MSQTDALSSDSLTQVNASKDDIPSLPDLSKDSDACKSNELFEADSIKQVESSKDNIPSLSDLSKNSDANKSTELFEADGIKQVESSKDGVPSSEDLNKDSDAIEISETTSQSENESRMEDSAEPVGDVMKAVEMDKHSDRSAQDSEHGDDNQDDKQEGVTEEAVKSNHPDDIVAKSASVPDEASVDEDTNNAVAMEEIDESGKDESALAVSEKTQDLFELEIHGEETLNKDVPVSSVESNTAICEVRNSQDASEIGSPKSMSSDVNLKPVDQTSSVSGSENQPGSENETMNTKECTHPVPFQSQTSAFTAIKPKMVPSNSDASRNRNGGDASSESNNSGGATGKRKFDELSDGNDDETCNKSTKIANSQDQSTQESVEDMSIGGDSSMSMLESLGDQVENDSDFYTPNASIVNKGDECKGSESHKDTTKVAENSEKCDGKEKSSGQDTTQRHEVPNSEVSGDDDQSNDGYRNGQISIVAMATKLLRPMKPALDPPTMSSVRESLPKHGLHEVRHQRAFWSRPQDKPTVNSR